ncbi:MAG: GNAT family N-acetyltransferase [Clostridiales bacterium GWB2_37_7]|nr:MAG: GNAT family N-acetyltransferase [Clostridiales bacterium GWB2_37_7]
MSEYLFIEAKEEHISELLEIYNYYVLNTTATFHSSPLSIEDMRKLVIFTDVKYRTYVIFEDDAIRGYVLLTQHKTREAYDRTGEVTVYLRQDYVGRGIGCAAINYIEKFARDKGFHALIATICGENVKSIKAFERNGYEKCAHFKEVGRKFGQWLDVVAYQKLLE